MDQERFDHLTRGLISGATRRGMVRQLGGAALGGVLTAVGLREASAKAKKKNGHGKGKPSGAPRGKVAVCHYDTDAGTYVSISVSQSGWDNGHAKHKKDFQQADKNGCCLDSECENLSDACHVGTCVVNKQRKGACQAVVTPGAPCGTENRCVSRRTCQADGACGIGIVKPCAVRECNTVRCNPATGECDYTPTPDVTCDIGSGSGSGTCNGGGTCVCKPKTCAELGRTCGTAPDDGCGNPLDCGGDAICGSETATNCCGGRCCTANGIACSSNAECCNGDCRGIGSLKTCWAFTDYTCAA